MLIGKISSTLCASSVDIHFKFLVIIDILAIVDFVLIEIDFIPFRSSF